MKFALWITGLFALAVLVGLAATVNTGYAILFLPPYRMEVSFNLLIVSVIVLIFVVHLVLRMVAVAANLPEEVRRFQRQKSSRPRAMRCAKPASPTSRAASRKPSAKPANRWTMNTRWKTRRWRY